MASNIHPTAVIEPGVQIGVDVSIGPYAVIEGDVEVGDRCEIGPHVMIGEGTRLGPGCRLFKGAAVGLIPQDKKFAGEKTYLHVGANTVIREFVTINRGTSARGETRIGNDCWIMAYCHVAHDCVLGRGVTASNGMALAGHVEIGNYATVGGMVPIHQFTRVGDYCMIGSTSRPFMDVVPYAMVGPEPTRIVGVNKIGLERHGFGSDRIADIKKAYRILFRDNLGLQDALAALERDFPGNSDVAVLVSFVKASTRGLLRMGGADENT